MTPVAFDRTVLDSGCFERPSRKRHHRRRRDCALVHEGRPRVGPDAGLTGYSASVMSLQAFITTLLIEGWA